MLALDCMQINTGEVTLRRTQLSSFVHNCHPLGLSFFLSFPLALCCFISCCPQAPKYVLLLSHLLPKLFITKNYCLSQYPVPFSLCVAGEVFAFAASAPQAQGHLIAAF